jgi:hypothetical protein
VSGSGSCAASGSLECARIGSVSVDRTWLFTLVRGLADGSSHTDVLRGLIGISVAAGRAPTAQIYFVHGWQKRFLNLLSRWGGCCLSLLGGTGGSGGHVL